MRTNLPQIGRLLLIFLTIAIPLYLVLFLFYQNVVQSEWEKEKTDLEYRLGVRRSVFLIRLHSTLSDLFILRDIPSLVRYLASGSEVDLNFAELGFANVSKYRAIYDQVRFIDTTGMEVIRVNNVNGTPVIVPKEKLQNKGDRAYFQEAMSLHKNGVYISDLELNREGDLVEVPYKPTIRFITPYYDDMGFRQGIVLTNLLAVYIFDNFRFLDQSGDLFTILLNEDGFFLYNGKDPYCIFGFQLPRERSHCSFQQYYGEAVWNQISGKESGQIETPGGVFTFTAIYPTESLAENINTPELDEVIQPRFYLILYSSTSMKESSRTDSDIFRWIAIFIFIAVGLIAFLLETRIEARIEESNKMEYRALHDNLTGLPNRSLFLDRLEHEMARATRERKHLALFFLDLDGFKLVNDTYGHEAGDHLLSRIASALEGSLRESDTVARIGGDEFCVIAANIMRRSDVDLIAKKILTIVSMSYDFKGNELKVSGSVGVTVPGWDEHDPNPIIDAADDAMYVAKRSGKNRYEINRLPDTLPE